MIIPSRYLFLLVMPLQFLTAITIAPETCRKQFFKFLPGITSRPDAAHGVLPGSGRFRPSDKG